MKEQLKGFLCGILVTALCFSGTVLAKTITEYIEVRYDNIKVYKDNVLCELKDSNGKVIEPFIYNGTTYMPIRGTANLADMEVTWEGSSKSVYLWDELTPAGTYLMEVCPPYESKSCETYLQQKGKSFQMAGTKYSNGFTLNAVTGAWAMFNLDSRFSRINFTIGHVDDTAMKKVTVSFFVDGKLIKEIDVSSSDMPKNISLPVEYGLQLKILTNDTNGSPKIGFGNITVE